MRNRQTQEVTDEEHEIDDSSGVHTGRTGTDAGVYAISVAGELTGVDPQMLRVYERRGLLDPRRTAGGTRRYSERDLDRVRRIVMYIDAGLNLAGIERVFVLEAHAEALSEQVRELGGVPRPA